MKSTLTIISSIAVILVVSTVLLSRNVHSADEVSPEHFEYVTLRWAGRENTHVIRPSGNVEFLGSQLSKIKRPDRADDRSFYMNIALNALAREGYEVSAITSDDYVMKRRAKN